MYGLPDSWLGNSARKIVKAGLRARRGGIPTRATAIAWKVVKVTIFKPQLQIVLNTPAGNFWHALHRRGNAIVRSAKRQVGVKTGALRASIHMRHTGNFTGQYLWIGSTKNYAYMHHEGTRPHIITPDRAPALVFRSGARIVRTPIVFHPGTRPNRYLSTPMREHLIRPIKVR